MQSLSAKGRERGSGVVAELASLGFEAAAIDGVAEERMPDRGEVDADLMRAPVSSRQATRLATGAPSRPR